MPPSASTRSRCWSAGRRKACIACWPRTAIRRWRILPRSLPRSRTRREYGSRSACGRWSSDHRPEIQHHAAEHLPGFQVFERAARLIRRTRLDRNRLQFPLLRQRHHLLQLPEVADVRADDADGALRDRRQRMGELAAIEADEHVAPALSQGGDAQGGCDGAADEVDRSGNALQPLHRVRRSGIERRLRAEPGRCGEFCFVDVAGDDVLHSLRTQNRDADETDPAAADHRYPVLRAQRGKLRARAVGSQRRAGERGRERFVDAARVHQVLRVRHEEVRGIGSGVIHTQESGFQAVIVLPRLADRTLAAADPGIHDALLPYLHSLGAWTHCLNHAERLMSEREGRHAAALLHVEALAAAPVEIAVPDMQVRMAHARARHSHEHLACPRFRCFLYYSLQRFAVLDNVVADHALPASCSAWSMSQRMSSSVSMPTEMRIMSGVTPAFSWSASLICRCVVEAGWMISVFASPMLAM